MSADQNSFNKGGMVTFLASMAASLGILVYVIVFGVIDLKEVKVVAPGSGPTQTQAAAGADAPIDVSGVSDPWMSSEKMVGKGKQLYKQQCAMCHGEAGKGDGPAGAALNPKPRNFQDVAYMSKRTDDQLRKVIQEGGAANGMSALMPSWKAALNEQDITNVIGYIRQLGKNVSK